MTNEYTKERVPEVGEKLHFWDDGKAGDGRHYLAVVTHILTPDRTGEVYFDTRTASEVHGELCNGLYNTWKVCVKDCDWLFAPETDYFIGCSVPEFDDHILWFVRTKDGGWFSMDIQSCWQGGRLDVTGEIYNEHVKDGYRYSVRI